MRPTTEKSINKMVVIVVRQLSSRTTYYEKKYVSNCGKSRTAKKGCLTHTRSLEYASHIRSGSYGLMVASMIDYGERQDSLWHM